MTKPVAAPQGTPAPAAPEGGDEAHAEILAGLGPLLAAQRAERADEGAETAETEPERPNEAAADKPAEDDSPAEEVDEEAEQAAAEEPEPEKPGKASAGLDAVHREKKRFDQYRQAEALKLQQEREAITRDRAEVGDYKQRLTAWKSKAKADPAGLIAELAGDLAPEEWDYVARQFYARSKPDPAARASADRERRERETSSKAEEALRRAEELEQSVKQREQRVQLEEQVREYVTAVEAVVTEKQPLLKQALAKSPKKTREELREVGGYLAQSTGNPWPDHEEVVALWEKTKRAQLEELGIDYPGVAKTPAVPAAPTKTKTPVADKKQRPGTLSNDLGNHTQPRSTPATREEEEELVLRELREGKHHEA